MSRNSSFRVGDLLVHPDRNVVVRDGQEIALEPRMMQVLVMLAEHAGETISPDHLLIEIWRGTFYGNNPVSSTVSKLRNAIGDDFRKPRYIETIAKVGYRLTAKVDMPDNYRSAPSKTWTQGSPYVGLSAFDAEHASVFCGRSRSIADLLGAMRSQIENEHRFVLLIGASGCGKTSLLNAGAIPLLTASGGFDGLRALSVARCDLAAAQAGDVLTPLVAALASWSLADRPIFPPLTTEQWKTLLVETPNALENFVADAFWRYAERVLSEQPNAHVLLCIDHAESLIATADAETRDAFASILRALYACPRVLTTMIARSDFYPKLIETLPELAERKAGDGHIDVLMPRSGEIGEIIRSPAWMADLDFETNRETRDRLDDVLRDAALLQPDALPLLQHTLQALYERRDDRIMTFAAYNEIGGLEGAIAHRAEHVFASLPANAQASLDAVLAKLIVIQSDSDAVSARRAFADDFHDGAHILVRTFIDARLFVSDLSDGRATVGVVHEALLRRWPRAEEWANKNRQLLRFRARLKIAAATWKQGGKKSDHLLPPGRPLSEATEVAQHTHDLESNEIEIVRASLRRHKQRQAARISTFVALGLLTLASFQFAITAEDARQDAEMQASLAITAKSDAEAARKRADLRLEESMRLANLIVEDPIYLEKKERNHSRTVAVKRQNIDRTTAVKRPHIDRTTVVARPGINGTFAVEIKSIKMTMFVKRTSINGVFVVVIPSIKKTMLVKRRSTDGVIISQIPNVLIEAIRLQNKGEHRASAEKWIEHGKYLKNTRSNESEFLRAFQNANRQALIAFYKDKNCSCNVYTLGQTAYWLGYYEYEKKNFKNAEAFWKSYLKLSRNYHASNPDDPVGLIEISYGLNNLGTLDRDVGKIDSAIDFFQKSADMKKEALLLTNNDESLFLDYIDSLSWVSSAKESRGRLTEAASEYASQLKRLRNRKTSAQNTQKKDEMLAKILQLAADNAMNLGDFTLAQAYVDESIRRINDSAAPRGEEWEWRHYLASGYLRSSEIRLVRKDKAGSLSHLGKAYALSLKIQHKGFQYPAWKRLNATVRFMAAYAQSDAGSLSNMDLPISDLEALAKRLPDDMYVRIALSEALILRGERKSEFGHRVSAESDLRRAEQNLSLFYHNKNDIKITALVIRAKTMRGHRTDVEDEIQRLRDNGYRHPDFLQLAEHDKAEQENRTRMDNAEGP